MTALLLETVIIAAMARAFALPLSRLITGASPSTPGASPSTPGASPSTPSPSTPECQLTKGQSQIATLVDIFAATYRAAYRCVGWGWIYCYSRQCVLYRPSDGLSELVSVAGDSLRRRGHLYYLGSGLLGMLGYVLCLLGSQYDAGAYVASVKPGSQ